MYNPVPHRLPDQYQADARYRFERLKVRKATVKQVIAIVRPYLAERLLESLRLAPLEALQVTEVKGFGRQKSYLDQYASTEYSLAFLPKVELSLWVDDLRVEEVLGAILKATRSGRMGDGKIMILAADDQTPSI